MNRKFHILALLIFLIIASVTIRDFLNINVSIGHNWDAPFAALKISYQSVLNGLPYLWNDNYSLGSSILPSFSNKIWWLFNALNGIIFNGYFIVQFRMILAMTMGGFLMYYYVFSVLASFFTKDSKKNIVFASFCAGLFFMLSPVFLGHFIGGAFNQLDTMILIPLLLIILHKGTKAVKINFSLIFLISFLLLLLATSMQNLFFGSLFVFLYILIFYNITFVNKIFLYIKIASQFFLFSFFWILPLVYSLLGAPIIQRLKENLNFDNLIYNVPKVSDAFFANGYIRPFYNLLVADSLYPYWKILSMIFASMIFFIIFFVGSKNKSFDKIVFFWTGLYLFFLSFATGFLSPLSFFVKYLYTNFSFMALFRSPQWIMMPLTISLSIILGLSIFILLNKYSGKKYFLIGAKILYLIIILFILYPTYFYGDLGTDKLYKLALQSSSWYKADHLDDYRIPDDYKEAISYLYNLPTDSKVLLLPSSANPYFKSTAYQREGAGVDNIMANRSPKPFIFSDIFTDYNGKSLIGMMEKKAYLDQSLDFLQFAKIFNAQYLMFKKDYSPVFSNYREFWDEEKMEKLLKDNINTLGETIVDGESTLLIKLKDKNFWPHIYVPNDVIFYDIPINDFISTVGSISINEGAIDQLISYLKTDKRVGIIPVAYKGLISNQNTDNINILFRKINPTKYKISVLNARNSFPVIFSETFDKNWKIYLDKKTNQDRFYETYFQSSLPEKNHFIANGYANSWTIDTDKICSQSTDCQKNPDGTYDLELVVEFWPQRLFYIGLMISGTTLICCLGYLGWVYSRRRKIKPAIKNNKKLDMNNKLKTGEIWDKKWENFEICQFKNSAFENDPWTAHHKPIIEKYAERIHKDGIFLEAGCGMGQWCFYVAEKYGVRSVGIDVAEKTISRLQKNNHNNLISFVIDDLNESKIENSSFDMFISLGVIEHFKDSNPIVSNLYRLLKPGGIGIITVPNIYSIHTITRPILKFFNKWDIGYEKSFSPEQLKKLSSRHGFKTIEYGVLPSGELFGCFLNNIPLLGKIFKRLSLFIEKKQDKIGFISFIVVQK